MSNQIETPESVSAEPESQTAITSDEPAAEAETAPATRRQLFRLGAAALAAAALATPRSASGQRIVRPHTTRPKAPPAPTGDSLLRLVRRATFGVTESEYARAKSMGFTRWLDEQLKPSTINDSEVEGVMATRYPNLALNGDGLFQQDQNLLLTNLAEATMYRAAFSKRQLYERMVNFWSDHFTIYYPKVNYLKLIDDREVIRKHALGKFPDMLRASAHSPAMLAYLDNTQSRVGNVNQNYAREIMELHSLGVDGGYTQTDVEEVTKCLTGWTIQGRFNFAFVPTQHDFTAKTVLGTTIPAMAPNSGAAGIADGEKVLDILVAHPSTATFISTKMIRWLLQYDPPPALVTKVAATYARTGGDIQSMIRDILTPANLVAAPAKYRQPYQMVVAALRASQATVTNINNPMRALITLGQPLFQWEDPDGFPDNVDWWAGTILLRWNYLTTLLNNTNAANGWLVDVGPLMTLLNPADITEAINRRAFAGEMPGDVKGRVTAFLAATTPINQNRVREAFTLALSSSAFQWY